MKLSLIILLFSLNAKANLIPQNKNEFCDRIKDIDTVRIQSLEKNNLISFKNTGGLFNGGVCWWHSKFQRNLFYSTILRNDLEKPSPLLAQSLIKNIRLGNKIVEIPGFNTIEEFTSFYQKQIQRELEAWQIYDGVVLGRWIDGLEGNTRESPKVLKNMMDNLFHYIEMTKQIAYQKLQIKGITSHAWLVVSMKEMSNGYEINYIDSNHPQDILNYSYKFGDDSFEIKNYGNFVPYLEYTLETDQLLRVGNKFCEKT